MLDQILHGIQSAQGQSVMLAMAVEMALRLIKSEKPMSILLAVSAVVHKIADICAGVAGLLDKVIPQKLK